MGFFGRTGECEIVGDYYGIVPQQGMTSISIFQFFGSEWALGGTACERLCRFSVDRRGEHRREQCTILDREMAISSSIDSTLH